MLNGKAMDQDSLPAEILKLELDEEVSEILYHFHSIASAVFTSDEVPQEWSGVTVKVLHNTKWIGPSVVTTKAFHLWHILLEFSS